MSTKELLLKEVEQVPEAMLGEILDFARYLKAKKAQELIESALQSESSLRKDWLKPEEEAAWRDL